MNNQFQERTNKDIGKRWEGLQRSVIAIRQMTPRIYIEIEIRAYTRFFSRGSASSSDRRVDDSPTAFMIAQPSSSQRNAAP